MDDGRKKVELDPVTEYTTESSSCWPQLAVADSLHNSYFFDTCNDRDGSILSEFGWNLPPPHSVAELSGSSGPAQTEFDRIIKSDLAGNNTSNSMIASGSSVAAATEPTNSTCGAAALGEVEAEPQPMVSSSSSDDLPEKSTTSSGSTDRLPSDTS